MRLAQISDTHLTVEGPESSGRIRDFEAIVEDINRLETPADLVIHTGDIVHNGAVEEYAEAARILGALNCPFYVLPGNKDDRDPLRTAFPETACRAGDGPYIQYHVPHVQAEILCLDTLNPGSRRGAFGKDRQEHLKTMLACLSREKPALCLMHHPPFKVPVGPDPWHFDDPAQSKALAAMIADSPAIVAAACGHVHRICEGQLGSKPARVATAVATDLRFGPYPDQARDRQIYTLHDITGAEAPVTNLRIAGDDPHTLPFDDARTLALTG